MKLSDNHVRILQASLSHFDRELSSIRWTAAEGTFGPMYRVLPLHASGVSQVARLVREGHEVIRRLRDRLELAPMAVPSPQIIGGTCAVLWEGVIETKTRYLEGYGAVPPELAPRLDPDLDALAAIINEIARTAREADGGREET